MRVLMIKTSSMGDVIHTLPALSDARAQFPDIVFDWVVEESFAEIPAWHAAVEQVIPVALRRWRRHPVRTLRSQEWKAARVAIGRNHYDYVVDAQGLLKSAWLTWLAKGAIYGYDRKSVREPLASLFYQQRIAVSTEQHAVERIRQLLAAMLGYPVPAGRGSYGIDRAHFGGQVPEDSYVVFLHGTTRADKHWPEAYWKRLASELDARGVAVRLPWGNDSERARAERIAEGVAGVSVLPRLNLTGLATVIARSRAVVAVDTGLGHLSAALDVPTVSLYGSTRPALIGAYGEGQVHLQASDYPVDVATAISQDSKEMQVFAGLTPQLVLAELEKILLS